MTAQQKVVWKRKDPVRFPKNPERWTCPDCGTDVLYTKRKEHQVLRCKNNK